MRKVWFAVLVSVALASPVLGACREEIPRTTVERETNPAVAEEEIRELVSGNIAFALGLYSWLRDIEGNIFFSPYSISLALAMAYAGARGDTAEEMARALHFTLPQDKLHPAFDALDLEIAARGREGIELSVANGFWGELHHPFLQEYVDLLMRYYGVEVHLLDFAGAPDDCRARINDWVRERTSGRIEELLPPDSIDPLTRLVLTNAIYFKGKWEVAFDPEATWKEPFHLLDGSTVPVDMMHQMARFPYAEGELGGVRYQAVELPYMGEGLAFVVLLPEREGFAAFEEALDTEALLGILAGLRRAQVELALPKFSFTSGFQLKAALGALGMLRAFTDAADFSGMDGARDLHIDEVYHKAFIEVSEEGTEAAAATGVAIALAVAPQQSVVVRVDHPFLFLIRDRVTGAVLFLGRVLDPSLRG